MAKLRIIDCIRNINTKIQIENANNNELCNCAKLILAGLLVIMILLLISGK